MTKNKLKVLHVRSTIGMYGAEQVILNVLPKLSEYINPTLLTLETESKESKKLRQFVAGRNVNTLFYKPAGKLDLGVIKDLTNDIKNSQYSIVHTHDYKSLFYIRLALKDSNIAIVHHIHGALGNTLSEKVYGFLEKWMIRYTSRIFTVSAEQKELLDNSCLNYPQVVQINNGTDVRGIKAGKLADETLKLIMVARFTDEKNHLLAVEMMSRVQEKGLNVSLTFLGDGPLMDLIKSEVHKRSLQDRINFVGFTRDVQNWLMRSDVLLITSRTEGMPMNMLEAMERSLPVISSSVGEIPKLIHSAKCGKIFNDLNELVLTVEHASENKDVWTSIGKLGREYIMKNLSVNTQAELLHDQYQDVLGM